ncbi:MAG: transcription factor FapR [Kyrpidia sp.]|nr:transcription factor FapR [Kyrpidia sp.]
MAVRNRRERQTALQALLESNPFLTDEEIAGRFGVSVQTIRLDRMALGIPEVRERIRAVAQKRLEGPRSLDTGELIGELIELELDRMAISMFEIREEHVFSRTRIARGHHLFAQANSLAVAVIDAPVALTASAEVRFVRPAYLGERLVAKAVVKQKKRDHAQVDVWTRSGEDRVFEGRFLVVQPRGEREGVAGSGEDSH